MMSLFFDDSVFRVIEAFLIDRGQIVVLYEPFSRWVEILSGLPEE